MYILSPCLKLETVYCNIDHNHKESVFIALSLNGGRGQGPSPAFYGNSAPPRCGLFKFSGVSAPGGCTSFQSPHSSYMMQRSAPCCATWDMGCDCLQHRFYDHLDPEEDFFRSMMPGEDVWEKFDLAPAAGSEQADVGRSEVPDSWTSAMGVFASLGSMIIQDCMWSGLSTGQRSCDPPRSGTLPDLQTALSCPQELRSLETECVDPAAIFPVPFNNRREVSSSCESSENEEEIDVVTVDSKQSRAQILGGRKPVTFTLRADPLDPHDPCMKRFHVSVHQQQHNYAAPLPDDQQSSPEPCCSSPPDTPQSSDSEDNNQRRTHNLLERERRNDLRCRYVALRDEIPDLAARPRTPKVLILTEALQYLRRLRTTFQLKVKERKQLRSRRRYLLRKLVDLQRL
ncbi:protein L-Myc [Arapaima gigas]